MMEALLASSILAIAIMGISVPFVAGAQHQQEDARRTMAGFLAQELMEDILSLPFDDHTSSGPEKAEKSRSQYDCINDYNGYSESDGQIKDAAGKVIDDPAAVGLSRQVRVTYVLVSQQKGNQPTFASIEVEMRYHGEKLLTLTRLYYDR